jgi:hypothetical protein
MAYFTGLGQSCRAEGDTVFGLGADNHGAVLYVDPNTAVGLPAGTSVALYVDTAGALRLSTRGAPRARVFVWLDASGPFANAGT